MKTHYFKSWKIQSNIIVRFAENGRFFYYLLLLCAPFS